MEKEPFFGTFWKPSFVKILSREASPYEFYAVVKTSDHIDEFGKRSGRTTLKGWRLEYRETSIYHPAFGVIPKETSGDYNLFVEVGQNGKRLDAEFTWPSNDVQLVGTDIKKVIETFEDRIK